MHLELKDLDAQLLEREVYKFNVCFSTFIISYFLSVLSYDLVKCTASLGYECSAHLEMHACSLSLIGGPSILSWLNWSFQCLCTPLDQDQ